jgi:hypothetical protein
VKYEGKVEGWNMEEERGKVKEEREMREETKHVYHCIRVLLFDSFLPMDTVAYTKLSYLLGYKIHIEDNTQETNKENSHHRLILGDIGRFVNSASRSNDMCIDRGSRPFWYYIRFGIERNHLGSVRRLNRC